MTSRDFIAKNFGVSSERQRQCSSVFADNDGNIYSYGYHYPLLFKVEGLTFRNTRGYSATTGKHISWCYGFGAIDVELEQGERKPLVLTTIAARLVNMRSAIVKQMDAKTRKDTAVYADLTRQLEQIEADMATVGRAM